MNRKKISELTNKPVRIRPMPLRFDANGVQLRPSDHNWFVREAGRHGVVIENAGYGHRLTLHSDQIHDFRTDPSRRSFGFLNLNGQVWVSGRAAGVEPWSYFARPAFQAEYGGRTASFHDMPSRSSASALPTLLVCGILLWAVR